MIDRKTHVAMLLGKLKDGSLSPHGLRGMIDAAKSRGEHETASRMQEAFDKNVSSVTSGGASGVGPRGGKYKLGKKGEKIYVSKL